MGEAAHRHAPSHRRIGTVAGVRPFGRVELIRREHAIPMEFTGLLPRSRYRLDAYRLRSLIDRSGKFGYFLKNEIFAYVHAP